MKRSTLLLTSLFAVSLAASGCQTKTSVVDGSGFEALHPSAATRQFIIANDRPFANEVAAHNRTCQSQPSCKK